MSNAINSIKKKSLKLSRKDRMRRNPIGWIVLLLISLGIGYVVWGDFQIWNQIKLESKQMAKENEELEEKISSLLKEKEVIDSQFIAAAKEFKNKESQIFPITIDTGTTAKIIEIYTLLLQRNGTVGSSISLKSLNFGNTVQVPEKKYNETIWNINLSADKESLRSIVNFLEQGEMAEDLKEKAILRDAPTIQFLEENLLPILNIKTLSISQDKSAESKTNPILNVHLQISLYSQYSGVK